ncbi:MAG: hypothetical protein AB8B97_04180 [Granulosicoccus sp.]
MNEKDSTVTDDKTTHPETWPRKMNKVLIGIGVLVFGLIIADRLVETFRADDLPDIAESVQETDRSQQVKIEPELINEASDVVDSVPDMEEVFGGRLVFVSASEPLYVVTDDDRRIDVGDSIDEETLLSGITDQGVVIDKSGDLLVIRLPDLAVQ